LSGLAVLIGDLEPELLEMALNGSNASLVQVGIGTEVRAEVLNVVNQDALAYARERAAEMVGMRREATGVLVQNPRAAWRIDEGTRDLLRGDITTAIAEGWSNERLASALAESYAFSNERATVIARTETNIASNAGALSGYKASGVVDGKQWLTAEDDRVSEECMANGDAGPNGDGVLFDLDAPYPSGDTMPPTHPNCRCAIVPFIQPAAAGATEEA